MRFFTKFMTPAVLAVGFIGVAGCDSASQAQTVEAKLTNATATQVAVSQWQVDIEKSHLKFSALQEGEAFDGAFEMFSADIQFSADNLENSSVTVTVPLSSVDAGSTDRNSTLPGKAWFSTKKFPDAVFTANVFKPMGEGAYDAEGELTIKGISRPLSLPFTLDVDDDMAVMRSTLEMNRTEWDIGEKPWNTDEWVSTGVKLDILVTAKRAN